jgi:hypothetical protein
MISRGHHVNAEIEELFRQRWRDSEPSRGIFAVGDHEIDGVLLAQFRQALSYDGPPGAPENVTDKKNFQDSISVRNRTLDGTTLKIETASRTGCWQRVKERRSQPF